MSDQLVSMSVGSERRGVDNIQEIIIPPFIFHMISGTPWRIGKYKTWSGSQR